MVLHLVKHSPFNSNALEDCIKLLVPTDGILLLENGAYGLIWQPDTMQTLSQSYELYILEPDAITRGISSIPQYFTAVNYGGFVDLTLKFDKSISW